MEIDLLLGAAQTTLRQTLAKARTLLQSRDLIAQWDDEAAAFVPEFLPIADKYLRLQRALLELDDEEFRWTHDLCTWVEAQR